MMLDYFQVAFRLLRVKSHYSPRSCSVLYQRSVKSPLPLLLLLPPRIPPTSSPRQHQRPHPIPLPITHHAPLPISISISMHMAILRQRWDIFCCKTKRGRHVGTTTITITISTTTTTTTVTSFGKIITRGKGCY